jgi:hypothetical protein
VPVADLRLPMVILLHGANGHTSDFSNSLRPDAFPYDYHSPLSPQLDLGWHWSPGVGIGSIELDSGLPNVQGWLPFLLANGCSTVSYDQIDAGRLAERPAFELAALLNHLLMIALPTSAIFDNPQVCFLTHSRGAIIVRKVL